MVYIPCIYCNLIEEVQTFCLFKNRRHKRKPSIFFLIMGHILLESRAPTLQFYVISILKELINMPKYLNSLPSATLLNCAHLSSPAKRLQMCSRHTGTVSR